MQILNVLKMIGLTMYLLDTNVISEVRKQNKANAGVRGFFDAVQLAKSELFISVITVGELRRGIYLIRHRGDERQALQLETWFNTIMEDYSANILSFTDAEAQVWGRLRVPHYQNAIDKQIAATALIYDLTLVTRNIKDFYGTGVKLINPFE